MWEATNKITDITKNLISDIKKKKQAYIKIMKKLKDNYGRQTMETFTKHCRGL